MSSQLAEVFPAMQFFEKELFATKHAALESDNVGQQINSKWSYGNMEKWGCGEVSWKLTSPKRGARQSIVQSKKKYRNLTSTEKTGKNYWAWSWRFFNIRNGLFCRKMNFKNPFLIAKNGFQPVAPFCFRQNIPTTWPFLRRFASRLKAVLIPFQNPIFQRQTHFSDMKKLLLIALALGLIAFNACDKDDNSVMVDSVIHPLQTPSAQQSGLKIKIDKDLDLDINTLTLDFDAEKSIVETGNGGYILKPVIKVKD